MSSFFNFTKGEWSASIFLLSIFIASLFFNHFYSARKKEPFDVTLFQQEIRQFQLVQQHLNDSIAAEKERRATLYQNRNYAAQGKSFRYDYPKSYDSIPSRPKPNIQNSYAIIKVDLNHCDTSDIMRIPLFGSKRAQKLVEYRESLGGFHSLSQLQEIFILQNIDTLHFEKYFTISQGNIKKIAINRAEYQELIQHPYFDAYLVKSVLHYRQKRGIIHNIEDFRQATNAYGELLKKVEPYLSFEE